MNWENGGVIAEIASAIGVIITLAYLAHQIAQTNRIAKAAVIRELEHKYIDLYTGIATDTEFAKLVTRLSDANYQAESEVEKEKLENFAMALASFWLIAQTSYDQGQIDRLTFQIYLDDVGAKLAQWPAIKPYAKQMVGKYPTTKDMEIFKAVLR
jgi:hypothetical protein